MIGDGDTEACNEKSDVFDNMANVESNEYTAYTPDTIIKNENSESGIGKLLHDNYCCRNSITTIDNLLKNMHRKWSLID